MLLNSPSTEKIIDFYGLWKGYIDSMCTYVEKTIPQYHQSITNLSQEYIEAWKNFSCSAIDIQRSFATKIGISASMPDTATKIVNNIEQESKKIIDVQNKIAITSIDAAKQTVNTMSANSLEFAALNKNMSEMLPSFLTIPPTRS